MKRALLLAGMATGMLSDSTAGERLDREQLLQYRNRTGAIVPVTTTADWPMRRTETVRAMEAIMGPLPIEKRVPLRIAVHQETDCGSYVRREISYQAEPGARVPAFLLMPKAVAEGREKRPAVLALMPTNATDGNRAVVGLGSAGGKPGRNYGEELVQRGFVVIVPPYPHLGDYKPDLRNLGYASGTMKAIWDNVRALDVLDETAGIAKVGYAAIGHSLGGHNSIYTAVFDSRITVIVSSCGFDSYLDYYKERPQMWRDGRGWTQDRYMPRLAAYADRLEDIPFDFHELISALAPRPFLTLSPKGDANFKWESVARILDAVRPVYALHDATERLAVEHPDCVHDFPPEMREAAYRWIERWLK